jgi:outer membrane immunogenic protein
MRISKMIGAVGVATILGIGAASAADLPMKAPPPLVAPVWSWTGFYVGGNAGWAGERASGTSDFVDTIFAPGNIQFRNPQSNSPSSSSFTGGVQAGYNWQVAPRFLLGVEGDWDWLNTKYSFCRQANVSSTACLDGPPNIDGFETIAGQTNWLATARARAGVTWDRFMFYGTGGAAFGSIRTTESLSCLTDGCGAASTLRLALSSSTTQTRTGWVAGLGVEGLLTAQWSIKAEWLHYDLGSLSNTFTTTGNVGVGTQSVVWSRNERFDTVRVGLNYHFVGGPVVARY